MCSATSRLVLKIDEAIANKDFSQLEGFELRLARDKEENAVTRQSIQKELDLRKKKFSKVS